MKKTTFIGSLGLLYAFTTTLSAQIAAFQGTLADYLALDAEGVSIGDSIFSDFQLLPRQQGASGFNVNFIDVVPLLTDPQSPGFRFDIMDGATAEDFFELRFSFRVSGVYYDYASLSLNNVNVRSDSNAGVDALLDLSATGDAPGSLDSLIAFAAPDGNRDLTANGNFSPVNDLTVELDAVIDGGGNGRPGEIAASIGSITLRIGESNPQPDFPLLITNSGFITPTRWFIEFQSTPGKAHRIAASSTLDDGFQTTLTLTLGDGVPDATGFERVEFDVSSLGSRQFFRVEKSI
jgi:hypothetical protein